MENGQRVVAEDVARTNKTEEVAQQKITIPTQVPLTRLGGIKIMASDGI